MSVTPLAQRMHANLRQRHNVTERGAKLMWRLICNKRLSHEQFQNLFWFIKRQHTAVNYKHIAMFSRREMGEL
jgi:hypothetical protein